MSNPRDHFAEAKARDALAFEPLPESRWITLAPEGLLIATPYSEALSKLIRTLPGRRWDPDHRHWIVPYSSAEALRGAWADLHGLSDLASDARRQEVAGWEAERRQRNEVAAARRLAAEQARAHEKYAREMEVTPAVLSPQHVIAKPGAPGAMLSLESIGDDTTKLGRDFSMPRRCRVSQVLAWSGARWLTASVPGRADYSAANSVGSRGVVYHYELREGPIYWISAPASWSATIVYFATLRDGVATTLTETEVTACLAR